MKSSFELLETRSKKWLKNSTRTRSEAVWQKLEKTRTRHEKLETRSLTFKPKFLRKSRRNRKKLAIFWAEKLKILKKCLYKGVYSI